MTEAKAELRRRSKKQKGKRASGNGRSNPMNCGNVTGGEKFEKGGRKNVIENSFKMVLPRCRFVYES